MNGGSNPSVVMLFPGALGDLLLALPTLRALRARHRRARVTLAVAGPLDAIARLATVADVVASLDDADTAGLFGGHALPRWFGERPIVYSWIGRDDPIVRARIGELATAATFAKVERGDGAEHAAAAYARSVGLELCEDALAAAARLEPGPSPAADALVARLRRPILAIHAGAGSRAKRWDAAGYAAVATWWSTHGDVTSLVGPADGDVPAVPFATTVCGWDLADVAALLGRVDAFVGNDGGLAHLAAAVGVRGTVVFGPTRAERWRPLGEGLVPIGSRRGDGALDLAAVPAAAVVDRLRALVRLDKAEGHT